VVIYKVVDDILFAALSKLEKFKDHTLICIRNITRPDVEDEIKNLSYSGLFSEKEFDSLLGNHMIVDIYDEDEIALAFKVNQYFDEFTDLALPMCMVCEGKVIYTNLDFEEEYVDIWSDVEDDDEPDESETARFTEEDLEEEDSEEVILQKKKQLLEAEIDETW